MSPHLVVFGYDPVFPDYLLTPRSERTCTINREDDLYFECFRDITEKVMEELKQSQITQKKYYDRGNILKTFKEGDTVLLKEKRLRGKFEPRWLGPYIITRKLSSLNYAIKKPDGKAEMVVHIDRIKLLPNYEMSDYETEIFKKESNFNDRPKEAEPPIRTRSVTPPPSRPPPISDRSPRRISRKSRSQSQPLQEEQRPEQEEKKDTVAEKVPPSPPISQPARPSTVITRTPNERYNLRRNIKRPSRYD